MNKIVIVEDRLGRAVSLAEQFVTFSVEHPEYKIQTPDICYFCSDTQKAEKRIKKRENCGFNIHHVTLANFNKVMDEYLANDHTFLIMDFVLAGDDSDGIPTKRVNIRYARKQLLKNHIWFYTATGTINESIIEELVRNRLEVTEIGTEHLRLNLRNEQFIKELKKGA